MPEYPVAETFLSINGEGPLAGALAYFIRFPGCNLRCSYCDTAWANLPDAPSTPMTAEALCQEAVASGAKNVTLTGGEPLLQPELEPLILGLHRHGLQVEAETNGAVDLAPFRVLPLSFTMDYKLPGSGMERMMHLPNLGLLRETDALKFVCGSLADLDRAVEILEEYRPSAQVFFSPVFGALEPAEFVEYMKAHHLARVKLQLQLHKYIWDPNERGV